MSTSRSPGISSLSLELLRRVFSFLPELPPLTIKRSECLGGRRPNKISRDLKHLLVAHVCAGWRSIALASSWNISVACDRLADVKLGLSVFPSLSITLYIDNAGWLDDKETYNATSFALKEAAGRITNICVSTDGEKWTDSPSFYPQETMRSLVASVHAPMLKEINITASESRNGDMAKLTLPTSARSSLRTVQLRKCWLEFVKLENEDDAFTPEQLRMSECVVPWKTMLARGAVRLAALRHLHLAGISLEGIGKCEKMDLCALESVTLEGDLDDVTEAFGRLVMPVSVDLHLICNVENSPEDDEPLALLTPLSAHLAPAHAAGDFFTRIFFQTFQSLGGQVRCSVPHERSKVLAANSEVTIGFAWSAALQPNRIFFRPPPPPVWAIDYVAKVANLFPLSGGASFGEGGLHYQQSMEVNGNSELWMVPQNWAGLASTLRGVTVLDIERSAAVHLCEILEQRAKLAHVPAWTSLRNIVVFEFPGPDADIISYRFGICGGGKRGGKGKPKAGAKKQKRDARFTAMQEIAKDLFGELRKDYKLRIECVEYLQTY